MNTAQSFRASLLHLVPRIDQEAAGPSHSVPRLRQASAARGHEVQLSCIAARERIPGVRLDLHADWPILNCFEVSGSLARTLRPRAGQVNIVHNHNHSRGWGWAVEVAWDSQE